MRRVLSSVGIGAATVDTVLPRNELTPSEELTVDVEIEGGDADQQVDGIYFAFATQYWSGTSHDTAVIDSVTVAEDFTIEAGSRRTIEVEVTVPPATPVTVGSTNVWLKTGLDIDWAIDPTDRDTIRVDPDPIRQAFFDAAESLGYVFDEADCKATHAVDPARPFVQEFDFVPEWGPYVDSGDLEAVFVPSDDGVTAVVQVEPEGGVDDFEEFADQSSKFSITDPDAATVEDTLDDVLSEHT
ncbi:sporulation protein [Haloarchaeobius sp. HME9146]|uniref:sporulation protein n=1 Tax=Haloarchaeobius sp. HME9146 TaxID=2978732 RepID=UPI0021BEE0E4|nr:sporulation protein [Haloarchaeobius sp. HME9146]MCT9096738.1 sporulation protein [Haloarchaeobius sp. HME9146]